VTLVGMEMSAVHVNDVRHPRTAYPRAIFLAVAIVMVISILAALSLAIIIPPTKLDLVAGMMQGVQTFCQTFHIAWLVPIIAALLALGMLTMASTWIAGPSKGLQVAALDGDIPHYFQKTNKHEMPVRLMISQAIIFTALTSVFLFMPSVSSSYWILVALTSLLYMSMYFILFITGIRMRYKFSEVYREYRVPGKGNSGMWIVGGLGIIGTTIAFFMSFIPPSQILTIHPLHYIILLISSYLFLCGIPMIFYSVTQYMRRKKYLEEPPTLLNIPREFSEK